MASQQGPGQWDAGSVAPSFPCRNALPISLPSRRARSSLTTTTTAAATTRRTRSYRDCIAAGNKKQFRIWDANVVHENCLATNPAYGSATGGEGGTCSLQGIWIDDVARVTVRFSTVHNAHCEVTAGGQLTFEDSILSKETSTTSFWTGTGVTLVRTKLHSPIGTRRAQRSCWILRVLRDLHGEKFRG